MESSINSEAVLGITNINNQLTYIIDLFNLFESYDFIIGQIKDSNGRLRSYSSNRVQGTTIGIKKFNSIFTIKVIP